MRFRPELIRNRFQKTVDSGRAIIGFGAGCGMSAVTGEQSGVDYISIYATAVCRMKGLPSLMSWLPYENANEVTLEAGREILPLIKNTPVFAGIGAHDIRLDFSKLVDELVDMGFSGVNNEPFISQYGRDFALKMEQNGMGFSREVELMRVAHEKGVFTYAWVSDAEEAVKMAEAGADMVGVMAHLTAEENALPEQRRLDRVCEILEEMMAAARAVNPNIFIIAHGDAVNDLESAGYVLDHTAAHGYATGSNGERLPAIAGIKEAMRAFKELKIKEK